MVEFRACVQGVYDGVRSTEDAERIDPQDIASELWFCLSNDPPDPDLRERIRQALEDATVDASKARNHGCAVIVVEAAADAVLAILDR